MDADGDKRESAYLLVIVLALGTSAVCLTSIGTALPLAHRYMGSVDAHMRADVVECQTDADGLLTTSTLLFTGAAAANRTRRQTYGVQTPGVQTTQTQQGPTGGQQCQPCCLPGAPGVDGLPGRRGLDGPPGAPGAPGAAGRSGQDCAAAVNGGVSEQDRMCAEPCPSGPAGPPGRNGSPGDRGMPGQSGRMGMPGADGEKGPIGDKGQPGPPGMPGDLGARGEDAQDTPLIPGPPGEVGESGGQGPPGPMGAMGDDGPDGPAGDAGTKGMPGYGGKMGEMGMPGDIGEQGADAMPGMCPNYCAMDGGVYFMNPDVEMANTQDVTITKLPGRVGAQLAQTGSYGDGAVGVPVQSVDQTQGSYVFVRQRM